MISIDDLPIISDWSEAAQSHIPIRVNFKKSDLIFDYLIRPSDSDSLIVFFPAAMPQGARRVPSFYRWSYVDNFDQNIICVSDPTLYLSESMLGGWFIGSKENWVLPMILKDIKEFAHARGIKKIIFSGASLGGFASLMAADLFSNDQECVLKVRYIAENPQVTLFKYMWINHIKLLLNTIFNVDSFEDLSESDAKRFCLPKIVGSSRKFKAKGFAIFKESDAHHYDLQRNELALISAREVAIISIPKVFDSTGHTPLVQSFFHFLVQSIDWDN